MFSPCTHRYATVEEEHHRLAVFRANLATIHAINADPTTTHVAGVGPFADLTPDEFTSRYTSPSPPTPTGTHWWASGVHGSTSSHYLGEHRASPSQHLPESIDWTTRNAVTAVKSQRCGNCWTFSACGSLEGAHAIATGVLTNYSEQEFVDCVDTGCNGGWNFNALKFAVDHAVCTLDGFPCTGKGNGTQCKTWEASPCSERPGALKKGALSGWKSVGEAKCGHTTENDLMSALQEGPISINMCV